MRQFSIIHSILSEPWAIREESAYSLTPMIHGIFNKNFNFEVKQAIQPVQISLSSKISDITAESSSGSGSPDQQTSFTISVITISGALTKEDQDCGPRGTVTIGNWIKNADADKSVDAIFLKIDSPGGSVSGIEELGNIIKNTSKLIIAFVDDQACSAAYWMASCCDEIIANNTTADVGSIGVLMDWMDLQPYFEKEGVKFHTITAPQSSRKTKVVDDIRAGKYDDYKNNVLKPLAQKFIDIVKLNRPASKDGDFFKGDVFFAQDVVGTLVDSIMSLDDALQHTVDLVAATSSPSASNQIPSNKMTKLDLNRFAKAAKLEAITANAEGAITLTAEAAQAVEAALEAHENAAAASATAALKAAEEKTALTTAQTRISELEAQVADLEKEPGAESLEINSETDASGNSTGDSFWDRFAALKKQNKR